jgi:hypothetical protein
VAGTNFTSALSSSDPPAFELPAAPLSMFCSKFTFSSVSDLAIASAFSFAVEPCQVNRYYPSSVRALSLLHGLWSAAICTIVADGEIGLSLAAFLFFLDGSARSLRLATVSVLRRCDRSENRPLLTPHFSISFHLRRSATETLYLLATLLRVSPFLTDTASCHSPFHAPSFLGGTYIGGIVVPISVDAFLHEVWSAPCPADVLRT